MKLVETTLCSELLSLIQKILAKLIGYFGIATAGTFIYIEFKDVLFQNNKLAMFFNSGVKYSWKLVH